MTAHTDLFHYKQRINCQVLSCYAAQSVFATAVLLILSEFMPADDDDSMSLHFMPGSMI